MGEAGRRERDRDRERVKLRGNYVDGPLAPRCQRESSRLSRHPGERGAGGDRAEDVDTIDLPRRRRRSGSSPLLLWSSFRKEGRKGRNGVDWNWGTETDRLFDQQARKCAAGDGRGKICRKMRTCDGGGVRC